MTRRLRVIQPSDWAVYKGLRLRALADAPDAFGSTLALEAQRPDAVWQQRLADAAASGADLPLFVLSAGAPVGLAWAKVDAADATRVNLFQMWVAPECRGRRLGRALLLRALCWARGRQATSVWLHATCGDTAAARLYERAGFVTVGQPEALRDGSPLQAQAMVRYLMPGARCG